MMVTVRMMLEWSNVGFSYEVLIPVVNCRNKERLFMTDTSNFSKWRHLVFQMASQL